MDAIEVVLGVGLDAGIPGNFVAEDQFAICPRGAFTIARAQVKANAIAIQMPAQRCGGFSFRGSVLKGSGLDSQWPAMHALADEFPIESARSRGRVDATQIFGDARIASEGDAVSAFLPEQELQHPLRVALVERNIRAFVG